MHSLDEIPPELLAFAEDTLKDRANPYVIMMSVDGLFDAETGGVEIEGGLRLYVAAYEYFARFTNFARRICVTHFQHREENALEADEKGRHPVDALFDDNDFPDDAVVVIFVGLSEWSSRLDVTQRVAERLGPEGRLMLVACDCTKEEKGLLADLLLSKPPTESILFTNECGGADTMYAIMMALAMVTASR